MEILNLVGVQGNVKCCLDVGASDSYPGSGSTIFDLSGNDFDWSSTLLSASNFAGTPGGLSPNEYMTMPNSQAYGVTAASANSASPTLDAGASSIETGTIGNFLRNWNISTAKFSLIMGVKIPASMPRHYNLFQTGANSGPTFTAEMEKGLALFRFGDSGGDDIIPNGHGFTAKQVGFIRSGVFVTDDDAVRYYSSGLTLDNSTFSLVQASIDTTTNTVRWRVNANANSQNPSTAWGDGNTSNDKSGSTYFYPNVRTCMDFDHNANTGGAQLTCLALIDGVALTSTQMTDIYDKFKSFRDPSLP